MGQIASELGFGTLYAVPGMLSRIRSLIRIEDLPLERPAPDAEPPEPEPAPARNPIEITRAELGRRGYWLGSTEMLEQAHRVTGGDASRAVDLLLLILR